MGRRIRVLEVADLPTPYQLAEIALTMSAQGDVMMPVPAGNAQHQDRVVAAADLGRRLEAAEDDPDDPTVLAIATSGSTGAPRIVLLQRSALEASAAATEQRLGGPGQWLLALGLSHIAGVQVVLRSIRAGADLVVCHPGGDAFAQEFVNGTDALTEGRRYTSLVPTQLRRLLALESAETDAALASYQAILLGGAAAEPALLRRATDRGINVVTTYGMTETSGGCVYDGVPLDGVSVSVAGDVGPISITGAVVARGYRGPVEGVDPFQGGTFHTSDAGSHTEGRVRVVGRTDDLINTGGHKVAPDVVVAALLALDGVQDAAVVGVPDPEWGEAVAAVVQGDLATDRIRSALRAELPGHAVPKHIVIVDSVPRLGIGKPDQATIYSLLRA